MKREELEKFILNLVMLGPPKSSHGLESCKMNLEACRLYAELKGWTNKPLRVDVTTNGRTI